MSMVKDQLRIKREDICKRIRKLNDSGKSPEEISEGMKALDLEMELLEEMEQQYVQ